MTVQLSDSLTLPCGVVLPNRLFKSAMTEGLADSHDRATDKHLTLYKCWSEGGTGTLVSGNVLIDRRFLERPGNVVIDRANGDNGGDAMLAKLADAGTSAGNQFWMQLNHPGRQCQKLVSARPLSPSEVPLNLLGLFGRPRAMTAADIEQVIDGFAHAALVAKNTGFTGVQVHSAHGYLLSQFLSPRTNLRNDEWGGSLENRARLLMTVIARVREAVGDAFPVSVKLNSADFSNGGFSHEDSLQVARWLSESGIDLLEISGGTYEKLALMGDPVDAPVDDPLDEQVAKPVDEPAASVSTQKREAYFLEYAAGIREVTNIPLVVTGGFRSRAAMEQALNSGAVDVIGIARPLCTEPNVHRLLSGDKEGFIAYEKDLALGSGWFGPNSNNRTLRTLNFSAANNWYYQHIIELANGREPNTELSCWRALIRHTLGERKVAKARAARE